MKYLIFETYHQKCWVVYSTAYIGHSHGVITITKWASVSTVSGMQLCRIDKSDCSTWWTEPKYIIKGLSSPGPEGRGTGPYTLSLDSRAYILACIIKSQCATLNRKMCIKMAKRVIGILRRLVAGALKMQDMKMQHTGSSHVAVINSRH